MALLTKFRATFSDFPRPFWTLVGASFIDRLGGALIFPFLSLYIANRFHVGLTEVGLLLGVWSISGLAGSIVGGAMTDKFGRRFMLIFGLIFSAGTALLMGFANDLPTFFWVLAFSGFLSDIGGPAQGAMVADLVPENNVRKDLASCAYLPIWPLSLVLPSAECWQVFPIYYCLLLMHVPV